MDNKPTVTMDKDQLSELLIYFAVTLTTYADQQRNRPSGSWQDIEDIARKVAQESVDDRN